MTSDPKAPGAAAVYLDFEQSNDNYSHYISNYARIKVLTERGKEYATVEVPYTPGSAELPIIEGRTIHSDGTVIPLTGKAADMLQVKSSGGRRDVAVFNLPSVEVGSILEYKWTIGLTGHSVSGVTMDMEAYDASALASSIPEWEVQKRLFVHKEHFYYNPLTYSLVGQNTGGSNQSITHYVDGEIANYLLYSQRLPAGAAVQKSPKDDYTLDIKDVPAIGLEENTPPLRGMSYRVQFYYSPYVSAEVFWDNEGKRWSKNLNHFAEPTDALRAAAGQIVAGAETDEAKARKLYDAVQALENTDFTRERGESERTQLHMKREEGNAQDVWNAKGGSGTELAGLFLALALAAPFSSILAIVILAYAAGLLFRNKAMNSSLEITLSVAFIFAGLAFSSLYSWHPFSFGGGVSGELVRGEIIRSLIDLFSLVVPALLLLIGTLRLSTTQGSDS